MPPRPSLCPVDQRDSHTDHPRSLDRRQAALLTLGRTLRASGYRFVTPTPETHWRVVGRDGSDARSLRDAFGWNRPFRQTFLAPPLLELCREAEILAPIATDATRFVSRVRYSTVVGPTGEIMVVHSGFPTEDVDSVFFGPDSYRFAGLLARTVRDAERVVDVGCGTGIGGLVLANRVRNIVLADVNPFALWLAAVNVALAGIDAKRVSLVASDVLAEVEGGCDLVIANPPYLVDDPGRQYRDGGGTLGTNLGARIVTEALARLVPGGRLVLYSGTPVVDGRSVLEDLLRPLQSRRRASWTWQEIDPDVFGEELERPPYRETERLAVVSLVIHVE